MKKHVKVYLEYFGYGADSWIPCEVCGATAVDIAHIIPRSKFGKKTRDQQDHISNLASLCRQCHYDYDFNNKWTREEMAEIHRRYMSIRCQ